MDCLDDVAEEALDGINIGDADAFAMSTPPSGGNRGGISISGSPREERTSR
jgi:hypothetical protein